MNEETKTGTVRVPGELTAERKLSPSRRPEWVGRVGQLRARGISQRLVLDRLAGKITAMLDRGQPNPAFATDDNGDLVVLIPDVLNGGHTEYRVRDGQATMNGAADGDPADRVARVHHWKPIEVWP